MFVATHLYCVIESYYPAVGGVRWLPVWRLDWPRSEIKQYMAKVEQVQPNLQI